MTHSRRWVVAYTKHLKQKRKIYHDGVLELCDSGAKVFLYDDSGKLIDSRFLKKHEVIESGGTLTFEAHLVDIGSLEGKKDLLKTDLKLNEKVETLQQKVDNKSAILSKLPRKVLNGINCRKRAPSEEDKKNIFRRRPLQDPLSVSANNTVVRKNEIHRLRAQQERDATQNDLNDFRKEGMNMLVSTVMLTSKDIGKRKSETIKALSSYVEWNVLYTTQITQKAKKYHDGILRLLLCGSHMNQIVLLSEDGSVLCSKYLKSAEFIKTGNKYEFPNHLVEICEPRTCCKEDLQKLPSKPLMSSSSSNIESKKNLCTAHIEQGVSSSNSVKPTEDLQKLSSKPLTSSSSSNIESEKNICKTHMEEGVSSFSSEAVKCTDCNQIQSNKPLRDAYQILQTLKKLGDENNFITYPVAQANASVTVDATNQRKDLNLQGDDTCKGDSSGCTTQASIPDITSTSSQKTTLKTKLEVDSLAIKTSVEGYSISGPGSLSTIILEVSADKYCSIGEPGLSNGKEDAADASHSILKENNSPDSGNSLLGITMSSAETLNANENLQEETKEGRCGTTDVLDGSSATHMIVENFESRSLSEKNFILDDFPTFDLSF